MSGQLSEKTAKAIRATERARNPLTPYAAAKKYGIALSTIYRALKRQRAAKK